MRHLGKMRPLSQIYRVGPDPETVGYGYNRGGLNADFRCFEDKPFEARSYIPISASMSFSPAASCSSWAIFAAICFEASAGSVLFFDLPFLGGGAVEAAFEFVPVSDPSEVGSREPEESLCPSSIACAAVDLTPAEVG